MGGTEGEEGLRCFWAKELWGWRGEKGMRSFGLGVCRPVKIDGKGLRSFRVREMLRLQSGERDQKLGE